MRSARTAFTLLGAAVLLGGIATSAAAVPAAPKQSVPVEHCDGVTVIVDFTDLDGEVSSGCAEGDPGSGREALESAGFVLTDDDGGFICAIDAAPAAECGPFEGSYWAYWQHVDGEWVSSQVGADQADPAPGDVEGWRYNDGSAPPPVPEAALDPTTDATSADTDTDAATTSDAATEDDGGGVSPALWAVLGIVVVGVVVGLVIRRSRSGSDGA